MLLLLLVVRIPFDSFPKKRDIVVCFELVVVERNELKEEVWQFLKSFSLGFDGQ